MHPMLDNKKLIMYSVTQIIMFTIFGHGWDFDRRIMFHQHNNLIKQPIIWRQKEDLDCYKTKHIVYIYTNNDEEQNT